MIPSEGRVFRKDFTERHWGMTQGIPTVPECPAVVGMVLRQRRRHPQSPGRVNMGSTRLVSSTGVWDRGSPRRLGGSQTRAWWTELQGPHSARGTGGLQWARGRVDRSTGSEKVTESRCARWAGVTEGEGACRPSQEGAMVMRHQILLE